ncbi:MAG TPA: HDOD domain-containing protein [Miltoncostaeaceae bacterium]|nr:HDOD domain-containing protein [Miltoncostaeaceae bacterium]
MTGSTQTRTGGRPATERTRLDARVIAEAAERLASPSPVVAGILELLGGNAPVRAIAGRVGQSPEISAHVLRLANSALFGEPVDTLDRAIVRLGERNLRALLMAASTYRLLESALPLYGLARLALLTHSTEVAQASQTVAARLDPSAAGQAYLGGLVHDLGKAILSDVVRPGPAPLAGTADERRAFGTDHARVGTWIARRWALPEEMCVAIEHHHDTAAPEGPVARAVWLADMLVHASRGGAEAMTRLPAAAAACGLPEEALEGLLTGGGAPEEPARPAVLTDRELQVLRLLATGAAAKQAALQLGCSVSTVHNHLHHVYRKLNVTGQAQALLMAREMGWV